MSAAERPAAALVDDLRAVLAGLDQARRKLADGDALDVQSLRSRLDACAHRLEGLDQGMREEVEPVMLAVLDELERTIATFAAERRDLGDRLRAASRSMTAGAAYRRAGERPGG